MILTVLFCKGIQDWGHSSLPERAQEDSGGISDAWSSCGDPSPVLRCSPGTGHTPSDPRWRGQTSALPRGSGQWSSESYSDQNYRRCFLTEKALPCRLLQIQWCPTNSFLIVTVVLKYYYFSMILRNLLNAQAVPRNN